MTIFHPPDNEPTSLSPFFRKNLYLMSKLLKKGLKKLTCIGYKKGEESSSQKYDRYKTVPYKKRKSTLPKIISPAVMATFEVRDEYLDNPYPVVMEDCVNKRLDETYRDISEHDIETDLNATKLVIEKYPDGHDDDE